mmetsp:Transcript_22680/g.43356  ORF Transcript_22680/g.43356 Transcript_22680/m.43356 type:complete len:121 (-) Transcript_22680:197-559(-)
MPPKEKAPAPPEKAIFGVYKNQGVWRARIFERDGEVYLGHYTDKEEAAKAYDKAVLKLRGVEAQGKRFGVELGLPQLNNDIKKYDLRALNEMSFEELVQTMRLKSRQAMPVEMRGGIKFQ